MHSYNVLKGMSYDNRRLLPAKTCHKESEAVATSRSVVPHQLNLSTANKRRGRADDLVKYKSLKYGLLSMDCHNLDTQ